ncbi:MULTISPECIES: alpha/beta hydrolase [unclassified Lysinibacillus]|uniref:alpha/beta hydrolase n=1 Tax=unclassified Lysinibacillus TaxID=2636778 RepID=UPI002012BC51|nr:MULTISPECIES: alpha/beta hydrolase [unclassified Lysinibacillus]MCL1696703.1 alpha/beta hydrolase [Lysinibacillus sp. BPa_S21]MCL1698816.1 alpha/beta hydrolase [Lysinibacillus sp. Bpr_S20]
MKNFSVTLKEGQILNYKVYGSNDNSRAVIYFHGFGSSASGLYINETDLDIKNVYIIAVNRPGYGNTSLKNYNMTGFSKDIKTLLEKLNLDKVDIVGWSAGGLYAQVFASMYPEYVKSLTLVGSAIPLKGEITKNALPLNWRFISFLNSYFPFMIKYHFKQLSKKINQSLQTVVKDSIDKMPEADQEVANQKYYQEAIVKGTIDAYQNKGVAVFKDALAMTEKISISYDMKSYKVYIWHGDKDPIWPLQTANVLNKLYTGCSFKIIKNQGHLLYLSHFDEILNEINK